MTSRGHWKIESEAEWYNFFKNDVGLKEHYSRAYANHMHEQDYDFDYFINCIEKKDTGYIKDKYTIKGGPLQKIQTYLANQSKAEKEEEFKDSIRGLMKKFLTSKEKCTQILLLKKENESKSFYSELNDIKEESQLSQEEMNSIIRAILEQAKSSIQKESGIGCSKPDADADSSKITRFHPIPINRPITDTYCSGGDNVDAGMLLMGWNNENQIKSNSNAKQAEETDYASSSDEAEDDYLYRIDKYNMNHQKRGRFFIFLVSENRNGALNDKKNFQEIRNLLGFHYDKNGQNDDDYYENKTKEEIIDILEKFSKEDHSDEDCCVCAISSHGQLNDQYIMGDGSRMHLSDFTDYFSEEKCPSLKGKPKLFFVQACRGAKYEDQGKDGQGKEDQDVVSVENTASNIEDLILASSTIPDMKSFRHTEFGSYYVYYLMEEIKYLKNSSKLGNTTVNEILTNVNSRLGQLGFENQFDNSYKKQMSCFRSNLKKDLYFSG